MIKQIWITQCDLCGKTEKVRLGSGQYNETTPYLPEGWERGHNKEFHVCPECSKYREKERTTGGRRMTIVMIDADKAIELLEGLYYRDGTDFDTVRYNIGVGAAISEIRHLKEEAEQESK